MGRRSSYIEYSYTLKEVYDIEKEYESKIADLEAKLAEKDELFIATKWKVDDLEKQLAEKDEEIEKLKKGVYKVTLGTTPSNQIDFTENFYVIQNQTAIAELEKVVEFMKTRDEWVFFPEQMSIAEYIDQQIKSLKGER